jgi:hypothetical protein
MKYRIHLLILVVSLFFIYPLHPCAAEGTKKGASEEAETQSKDTGSKTTNIMEDFKGSRPNKPIEAGVEVNDFLLQNIEYEKSMLSYYKDSLQHRKNIFHWSLKQSIIIFWMVLFIVFLGLTFSAIQFYISMLNAKRKTGEKSPAEISPDPLAPVTSLKLSVSGGVEVNSSVLGVIILVISLAFFYLYLIYVYPVNEFNVDNKIQTEISANK